MEFKNALYKILLYHEIILEGILIYERTQKQIASVGLAWSLDLQGNEAWN